MTIYVDNIRDYGSGRWCHMMTDGDIDELHKFAKKLGLKREWFQKDTNHPHYDLKPPKRKLAIEKGAEVVSTTVMLIKCGNIMSRRLRLQEEMRKERDGN